MEEPKTKPPSRSRVEMTQLVLPGDTNPMQNAFGGKIMQWIDMAAGVVARRHAGRPSVTASMDSLTFRRPVRLGDVVVLHASVNRAWKSSMEIGVRVECEAGGTEAPVHAATAYLTFVSVDTDGAPYPVPGVDPQTDDQRRRYLNADQRRAQRLALRGARKK